MRTLPKSCGASTNLAAATELLWSGGCGALPVIDAGGMVIGIITDRDICVAVGTRDQRPSELVAEQAMSRKVTTCRASDDIHVVLKLMRTNKVRRLPVVSDSGKLVGILSLSDLILYSRHDDGCRPELSDELVMGVLKAISWVESEVHTPVMGARQ
jgi:CBS-domain-containing membrane protein